MDKRENDSERRVDKQKLRDFIMAVFGSLGVSPRDRRITADALVHADLRGMHSHGVMRVPIYVERMKSGGINPSGMPFVVSEKGVATLINGDDALGQVTADYAMREAIRKAESQGIGMVGVVRGNHFGEAAYFSMKALSHNMIGVVTCNGSPNAPAWGGKTMNTGPYPISVAVPSGRERPLVLDMATGVVSKGKVFYAAKKGKKIPEDWGRDKDGRPTTDPKEILNGGWVNPIGGYKGWGLCLVIDVFSGILTGAGFGKYIRDLYKNVSEPQGFGMCMCVVSIDLFMPVQAFKQRIDVMIRDIKNSDLAAGFERIYIPGEIEFEKEKERRKYGIPLEQEVLGELNLLAKELGLGLGV